MADCTVGMMPLLDGVCSDYLVGYGAIAKSWSLRGHCQELVFTGLLPHCVFAPCPLWQLTSGCCPFHLGMPSFKTKLYSSGGERGGLKRG